MEVNEEKVFFRAALENEVANILNLLYGSVDWDMLLEDFLAVVKHDSAAISVAVTAEGEYIGGVAFMEINEIAASFGIFYIKEEYQGKGIGMALHEYGREHVKHLNIIFTSVESMVNKYQNLYYPLLSDIKDNRYCGKIDKSSLLLSANVLIVDYSFMKFQELCDYDQTVFTLDRQKFWNIYLPLVKGFIVVAEKNNKICGYGILRKNSNKIGPLLADNVSIAHTIIKCLIDKLFEENQNIILDIPNVNSEMMDLALKNNMKWQFTVARMYSKEEIKINWRKVHSFHSFLH